MNISASQFSAGLSAIQSGQQQMTEAAQNIAQSGTANAVDSATVAAPAVDVTNITEQLLQLEQAKIMTELGAKVVSSAEETLGTLIDIQS